MPPPERSFTHAGATLVVQDGGGAAPAFVLLHGIGMGRRVFGDLTRFLAAHGRVLAIDLPGYGAAPEPARTLTMQRTADLVAAFIRSEGLDRPVIVGHSMGSQVAAELAARHPELVGRVVLCAPTVNERERTARRQFVRLLQDLVVESPGVLLLGAREYLRAGPHLRRKLRAMLAHRPELAYLLIQAPTLVLRGADDPVAPRAWCERIVSLLPDGRLAEVTGHGHETMIRDAAPAAERILEFVRAG